MKRSRGFQAFRWFGVFRRDLNAWIGFFPTQSMADRFAADSAFPARCYVAPRRIDMPFVTEEIAQRELSQRSTLHRSAIAIRKSKIPS